MENNIDAEAHLKTIATQFFTDNVRHDFVQNMFVAVFSSYEKYIGKFVNGNALLHR